MSDIVFMDTETLGVHIDAPIWEFAAIRRNFYDGAVVKEHELHMFIHHYAKPWLTGDDALPEQFQADYRQRFDASIAYGKSGAAEVISGFLAGKPHIVGAVPNFDTERISHQLLRPAHVPDPWHYHLIDVEALVMGYLHGVAARAVDEARMRGEVPNPDWVDRQAQGRPPWKSDDLSNAIGVDPEQFDRHTAMGDVLWVKAQFDAVMGGAA
ncbi:hypothetical protein A5761_15160 [Mycolicibacterium setense]|uniref:hypothetical protein n=1 Tax=Mycolicibacterium setense TaxID=431269 RepID=UPI0007EAF7C3|nr:hypothetical protein [Mycolicibacterium setense]OBB15076.1 hypothetical protein A5761_15160 [Mycolicibacterium setense]